jgi:hypothetical protein
MAWIMVRPSVIDTLPGAGEATAAITDKKTRISDRFKFIPSLQ